jgi:hypothetical protein
MQKSSIVSRAAACCIASGLITPAIAAGAAAPQDGETIYVTGYAGRVIDVSELGNGDSEMLVQVTGMTRNALGQPTFDNMSAHCLVLSNVVDGKPRTSGACRQTDSDGDTIFTSFDGDAQRLIGGTGKYKGISGSALYTLTPEPSPGPGKIAYSAKHDITWTFK